MYFVLVSLLRYNLCGWSFLWRIGAFLLWCLGGARAKAVVKWVSFSLVLRAVEGGRRFSCFSVGNRSDP